MDVQSMEVQALITFVMPLLIQLAKRSDSALFAWIGQNKPKVCVLTSGATALLTSMGIQFVYTPHTLSVSWQDSTTLARGLATFLVPAMVQFVAQHALYDGFWKHAVPTQKMLNSGAGK